MIRIIEVKVCHCDACGRTATNSIEFRPEEEIVTTVIQLCDECLNGLRLGITNVLYGKEVRN